MNREVERNLERTFCMEIKAALWRKAQETSHVHRVAKLQHEKNGCFDVKAGVPNPGS